MVSKSTLVEAPGGIAARVPYTEMRTEWSPEDITPEVEDLVEALVEAVAPQEVVKP